jgi:hypothetical protein
MTVFWLVNRVAQASLPRDHGRLAALEASHTYLRRFTPQVLEAVDFQGGPGTADLMGTVEILKELEGRRSRRAHEDVLHPEPGLSRVGTKPPPQVSGGGRPRYHAHWESGCVSRFTA